MNKPELIDKDPFYKICTAKQTCHQLNDPYLVMDPRFRVTDIPNVMRNVMNWPKSAELMELWFKLPAREMNIDEKTGKINANVFPEEYTNTTMFTWSWLEQFDNVQKGLCELKKALNNKAARRELTGKFTEYIASHKNITFPFIVENSTSPKAVHFDWYYQHVLVEYQFKKSLEVNDSLDDLYGSLGNFGIYAAVTKGKITRLSNRSASNSYLIHITEVAIYMRDTYDFIGSQYLGHWEDEGLTLDVLGGLFNKTDEEYDIPFVGSNGLIEAFGNADFRTYRNNNNLGGDLLLFSDAKLVPVDITLGLIAP